MRQILIAFLTCSLFAQTPTPPPVTLKATTRLVQISVVVLDKKGQPVSDLKKEDFQIKVDGRVQSITVFSVDSAGTLPANTQPLPPNTFTNRLEQRPGTPSTVTIILLDGINTRFADQAYAKQQVVKYLQTIQPSDRIGLYALGGSLRVLHDYTSDSTELLRKLAAYNGNLPSTANSGQPFGGDSLLLDQWVRGGGSPVERSFYLTNRIEGTLHAIEFIANHLARLPGRKNLIWVSGGFPLTIGFENIAQFNNPAIDHRTFSDEVNRTVQAVNNANMAIYPVDARGLMVNPQFSAERGTVNVRRPPALPAAPVGVRNQESMQELASRTGGHAYINTNDLKNAIRDAVSDSQVTYTLGFYPTSEKYDGKFHEIKLQIPERSGLNLRYRKGFFDLAEQPQDENARRAGLRDAVYSPIDATAMGLTVELKASAAPRPYSIEANVRIDRDSIHLEPNGTRWAGKLDILFVQKDDRGNQFNGETDTVELNLLPDTYDKITHQGLLYKKVINRDRRASMFRVVVRDAASGSIGSVTVPFNQIH
ncbi:MAG TPA: VWA domain-containing protein [Bryobacteraceae bacterium]|nr:VWA domain-containing protein [Bryobacteraceae bacterium]